MAEPAPGARPGRAGWLVAGAALAAHATSFAGTFQLDDWNVIVDEPRVASLAAWWGSMPGIRPLTKLSFALNRASGLGLAGFHAVNLALHAACSLLALALLSRLERRLGPEAAPGPAALLGALLFALHPVQTEAVAYVSGRSMSLSALLALASAVAWLDAREAARPGLAAWGSAALLALSLSARENALVLPAALLALALAGARRPVPLRAELRAILPHGLVVGAALAAALASPTYRRMVAASLSLRAPGENLLAQLHAAGWLAGQLVGLHPWNADPALPAHPGPLPLAASAAALGLALLGAAWALWRGRRAPALALAWFLLWLSPSGWWLPRPDLASERQLYVALLGPAWLAGRWLAPLAAAGGWRRAAVAALLALVGLAAARRSLVYRDEVGFWEDVVAKSPHNARGWNNLGFALAARCRRAEAEEALARARELDPGDHTAAVNLLLLREGEPLGPGQPRCGGAPRP